MYRNFHQSHKHSEMAPLKKWKKKDILAMVPESVKIKFSLEAYPECVLQELFLVERAVIPNLFGEADVLYSMDLTDAAKICRVDISRVYEPYKRKQEAEKRKKEAEWAKAKKAEQEQEKKEQEVKKFVETKEDVKQEKLFEEDSQFSATDPVVYFAKVEYRKSNWNPEIKHVVYVGKPIVADAVIFAGVIYLGGWKPQNRKVSSKDITILKSQPGTLYDAPEPYKGIISQHPEIEERMAAQKAKARKEKEATARRMRKIWAGAAKRAEAKRKAEEKARKAAEREEKLRLKEEEKARKAAEREARKAEKENKKNKE